MSALAVTPISAIHETVHGLFGAAQGADGMIIWCRGRKLLERKSDEVKTDWRDMTLADLEHLLALGAIDEKARDRMEIRLMR